MFQKKKWGRRETQRPSACAEAPERIFSSSVVVEEKPTSRRLFDSPSSVNHRLLSKNTERCRDRGASKNRKAEKKRWKSSILTPLWLFFLPFLVLVVWFQSIFISFCHRYHLYSGVSIDSSTGACVFVWMTVDFSLSSSSCVLFLEQRELFFTFYIVAGEIFVSCRFSNNTHRSVFDIFHWTHDRVLAGFVTASDVNHCKEKSCEAACVCAIQRDYSFTDGTDTSCAITQIINRPFQLLQAEIYQKMHVRNAETNRMSPLFIWADLTQI